MGDAAVQADEAGVPGASEQHVFKKPRRNANIRKLRGAEGLDVEAAAGNDGPSVPLVVMRELQRQRQRTRGVTLEPKGGQEADEPLDIAEDDHGLESTFTAQSDAGEVDPNMLKYIEEQMRKDEADGAATAQPADDEDGLYVTPAHLQGRLQAGAASAELEDAQRWLAGITEVSLTTEDKMAAIEETERAKRKLMAKQFAKRGHQQAQMSIPTNFNSNFHMHRRETAILRKESRQQGGRGGGMQKHPSGPPTASDNNAVQAFRRNERDRGRR